MTAAKGSPSGVKRTLIALVCLGLLSVLVWAQILAWNEWQLGKALDARDVPITATIIDAAVDDVGGFKDMTDTIDYRYELDGSVYHQSESVGDGRYDDYAGRETISASYLPEAPHIARLTGNHSAFSDLLVWFVLDFLLILIAMVRWRMGTREQPSAASHRLGVEKAEG